MISIWNLFENGFNPKIHSHDIDEYGRIWRMKTFGSATISNRYTKDKNGNINKDLHIIKIKDKNGNDDFPWTGRGYIEPDTNDLTTAHVGGISTSPQYRNRGLGNRIFRELIKNAKNDKYKNVSIADASANNAWKHFSPKTKNATRYDKLPIDTSLQNLKNVGNTKLSTILSKR